MKRVRGGKRSGAGRPKLGRVRKVITLAPESVIILRDRTRRKKTPGQVIDRALSLLKAMSPDDVERTLALAEMAG